MKFLKFLFRVKLKLKAYFNIQWILNYVIISLPWVLYTPPYKILKFLHEESRYFV